VQNLGTHLNTWIMYRLRFEPDFFFYYKWMMQPEMETIKDTQQFLVSYFYFAQNACAFLFALNRYTERNLTIQMLCVFASQAANIIVVIINSIFVFTRNMESLKVMSHILPFMSDLFSLGPAV
ncbi:hypothetical protein PENTCL1PPCAC_29644, partial [Pristionchus entomophagus]